MQKFLEIALYKGGMFLLFNVKNDNLSLVRIKGIHLKRKIDIQHAMANPVTEGIAGSLKHSIHNLYRSLKYSITLSMDFDWSMY